MPNFTPNLNLKKPLQTENYNIDDQNGNMDLLDTAVSERLKTADKATQSDAETGTDNTKYMTPLATKQAVLKFAPELEYKDVINLSATTAGVITWGLPLATDQTRTAIMLCRANKDINNMDYASCLADSSVTKNALGKDAITNTYTGLTNNTQYWVKCFVEYVIGGKKYYSNGVTVTFTTPAITITEFYNAGNEFTAVTGGWVQKFGLRNPPSSFVKNPTDLQLYAESVPTLGSGQISCATVNTIDFSTISKVKVELDIIKSGGITAFMFQLTSNNNSLGFSLASFNTNTEVDRSIITIDTSNISQSLYFLIANTATTNDQAINTTAKIYRVWGES